MSTSAGTAKRTFPSERPLFYYITDRKQLALAGRTLPWALRRAIRWGVDFIQIREKDLDDRQLFGLSRLAVRLAQNTQCRVIVNGRADIALAAGAHGVHLPSNGLRADTLRTWLPRPFLAGVSVHSRQELVQARRSGADYVLLGHVLSTASKMGYGPPLGVESLRRIHRAAGIPVLALGGIHPEHVEAVLDTGVEGVAGITLFQSALDLPRPPGRKSPDR